MARILPFETSDDENKRSRSGTVHRQRFRVDFEYDVHFTRDVFQPDNALLLQALNTKGEEARRGRHRVFVCIDSGVADAHPAIVRRIKDFFHVHQKSVELVASPEIVPGGERVKSDWQAVQDIMITLGNQHMDRQSYVLAIGGGSVLDMVGFVTALIHRGLRLVRMPTTVLGQNDAGVGVKNGMNEHGMKNFVGAFAPPFAVINDFSFLSTLSDEHWSGGVAEAFKVAIIKDREFFEFLVSHAPMIGKRDQSAMEETVRRCAVIHLEHIATSGDPFEMGTARPLDFGHWSAHKLEALSEYRISHGSAVAAGIAIDAYYAMKKGLITHAELDRVIAGLSAVGCPLWYPELDMRRPSGKLAILEGLEDFREHLGGQLTITLPRSIGEKIEVHEMSTDIIEEAVVFLRSQQGRQKTVG